LILLDASLVFSHFGDVSRRHHLSTTRSPQQTEITKTRSAFPPAATSPTAVAALKRPSQVEQNFAAPDSSEPPRQGIKAPAEKSERENAEERKLLTEVV
jgi:hypothetical protein